MKKDIVNTLIELKRDIIRSMESGNIKNFIDYQSRFDDIFCSFVIYQFKMNKITEDLVKTLDKIIEKMNEKTDND